MANQLVVASVWDRDHLVRKVFGVKWVKAVGDLQYVRYFCSFERLQVRGTLKVAKI